MFVQNVSFISSNMHYSHIFFNNRFCNILSYNTAMKAVIHCQIEGCSWLKFESAERAARSLCMEECSLRLLHYLLSGATGHNHYHHQCTFLVYLWCNVNFLLILLLLEQCQSFAMALRKNKHYRQNKNRDFHIAAEYYSLHFYFSFTRIFFTWAPLSVFFTTVRSCTR